MAQEQFGVAIFCMAVVGAVLGFLVFNANPAKVFMGDTGSLALGGAIAYSDFIKTRIATCNYRRSIRNGNFIGYHSGHFI